MKVGILTLHFANNYGASLQVYSLQKTMELLGFDTIVINYANQYQIDADSLYPTKNGIKRCIKRLMMIADHNARHDRIKKFDFEGFWKTRKMYSLSGKRLKEIMRWLNYEEKEDQATI